MIALSPSTVTDEPGIPLVYPNVFLGKNGRTLKEPDPVDRSGRGFRCGD